MSEQMHLVCPHCHAVNRVAAKDLGSAAHCGRCHKPLFEARPLALDQHSFDRHVQRSDLPLLVDFWAPWCGPCRAMAPHFDAAAAQLEPQMRLAKVNTEAEPALAARFQIRSIPTLALFKGGRLVASQPGAMTQGELLHWARAHA